MRTGIKLAIFFFVTCIILYPCSELVYQTTTLIDDNADVAGDYSTNVTETNANINTVFVVVFAIGLIGFPIALFLAAFDWYSDYKERMFYER